MYLDSDLLFIIIISLVIFLGSSLKIVRAVIETAHWVLNRTPTWLKSAPVPAFVVALMILGQTWLDSNRTLNEPLPISLIKLGAGYGPRILDGEAWRLFTFSFIHTNWMSVALNSISILLLGSFIVRAGGIAFFVFTLLLSGVCGAVAASIFHAQSVVAGASAIVCGFIGASVVIILKSPKASASKTGAFAIIISALLSILVTHNEHYINTTALGGGLLAGFTCAWVIIGFPIQDRMTKGLAFASLIGLFGYSISHIPRSEDRLAFVERLDSNKKIDFNRLAHLQNLLTTRQIDEARFISKLENEVLDPIESQVQEIEQLMNADPMWEPLIQSQLQDLKISVTNLQIVRDIYEAKNLLLEAEDIRDSDFVAAEKLLDRFWEASWPKLQSHTESLESISPASQEQDQIIEDLKEGLTADLRALAKSAIEIEVLKVESWLRRAYHHVSSPTPSRAPASSELQPDSAHELERKVSRNLKRHHGRLAQTAHRVQEFGSPLKQTQLHLAKILDVLEQDQ